MSKIRYFFSQTLFNRKSKTIKPTEENLKQDIINLRINGYSIPTKLRERIEKNEWHAENVDLKNLAELLTTNSPFSGSDAAYKELINRLYLYNLVTMVSESKAYIKWIDGKGDDFYRGILMGKKDSNAYPGDIDPKKSIMIADFGIGAEQAFALDYRDNERNPSVIFVYWANTKPDINNKWKKITNSYEEFDQIIFKK